jgi:hypothetical protein
MCGAAGALLPCAETRDSVGVGVGVGFGGSLGFIGFGGAGAANGGFATGIPGAVPAAEWDLLLPLLPLECDSLWNYATGCRRKRTGCHQEARGFGRTQHTGKRVEDDCCCCDCYVVAGSP